jgi:hypothetical protein
MTSFISNVVFVLILDLVHQAEKTCVDKNVFSYKLSCLAFPIETFKHLYCIKSCDFFFIVYHNAYPFYNVVLHPDIVLRI